MRYVYIALGFIIGACVSRPMSDVIEYQLDSLEHVLRPERGEPIHVGATEGYRCFSSDGLKSIKRYIVDLEQQVIECQKLKK